jgi:hypothetical protein
MKKFLLGLYILGTIGSWMFVGFGVQALFGPGQMNSQDSGLLFFVALQAIAFPFAAFKLFRDLRENPPGTPPLVTPDDPDYETVMSYVRLQRRRLTWILVSPVLLIGGCTGWIFFDAARSITETSQFSKCINYRRTMDGAMQAFVTEKNRPVQSLKELAEAKLGGELPKCPAGGTYTLVKGKEAPVISKCSIHGSADEPTPQKHPFM